MIIKKDIESIKALVDDLNSATEDSAIIVEGKKDKEALQELGIRGEFYIIKQSCFGLKEAAEKISKKYKKVIFMIDKDPEGLRLLKSLKSIFSKLGVKTNDRFMFRLLLLCDSATVEGCSLTF